MRDQELYDHAYTMLAETNVYPRSPDEILYQAPSGAKYSLPELIWSELFNRKKEMGRKGRKRTVTDYNEICFDAIGNAMAAYIEHYPAPVSFKKRTRERFVKWLEVIRLKYGISCEKLIPEQLNTEEGENDTVVGLLLSLQSRRGVTKKELKDRLGIGPRAILKDLCKLDPALRKGGAEIPDKVAPFYLGGQPVRAKIQGRKYKGEREKRYRTENSIHPLILQENLFQAATLLQALQRNYDEHESTVSSYLAVDIWSQLSDYARERIEYVFAAGDPDFACFLEMLKDETPDERIPASFRMEREIITGEWSARETLMYCSKAYRICDQLLLKLPDERVELFTNVHIKFGNRAERNGGEFMYIAVTEDGTEIPFREQDVEYIIARGQ